MSRPPMTARWTLVAIALSAVLTTAACTDDTKSSAAAGVLQRSDLPDGASTGMQVDSLPPIGAYCQKEFGGILGPSFNPTGMKYTVGKATVTSLVTSNPDVGDDRIRQIRSEIESCATATQEPHQIEVIDLGDHQAAFSAPAYDAAESPAGEMAIARVDRTYVIVAVTDAKSTDIDLAQLIDRAVDRAASAN